MSQPFEDAIRKCIKIDNENFYITVGKKFVTITIPHENRKEHEKLRQTVDSICDAITQALGELKC